MISFRLLETYFKNYAKVGSNSTGQINLTFTDKKTHSTFSVADITKQTGQSTEPNGFYLLEQKLNTEVSSALEHRVNMEIRFVKDGEYTSYTMVDWEVHLKADGNNYTVLGSGEQDRYLILDRAMTVTLSSLCLRRMRS